MTITLTPRAGTIDSIRREGTDSFHQPVDHLVADGDDRARATARRTLAEMVPGYAPSRSCVSLALSTSGRQTTRACCAATGRAAAAVRGRPDDHLHLLRRLWPADGHRQPHRCGRHPISGCRVPDLHRLRRHWTAAGLSAAPAHTRGPDRSAPRGPGHHRTRSGPPAHPRSVRGCRHDGREGVGRRPPRQRHPSSTTRDSAPMSTPPAGRRA